MTAKCLSLAAAQRACVALMMTVISRGLCAASINDDDVGREVARFRPGYTLVMTVSPDGPRFGLEVTPDGHFTRSTVPDEAADLVIRFKHLTHAFRVFTFQVGTARALATDRMVADGDLSGAIRVVRCLNRIADRALNDGSIIYNPKEADLGQLRAILDRAWG
jgi:hypothetical protein|tara:strand:+ start:152 stop:640 length:489 start_codon:yes stop_codon:yes gene_type:complete